MLTRPPPTAALLFMIGRVGGVWKSEGLSARSRRSWAARELSCDTEGLTIFRRSVAIRFSAVLSSTTTQSALSARRFRDKIEL